MLLSFDINKTIAAVAFLIRRENGEVDVFLSLKMLYLADKEALIKWGKTITGDSFSSLPKGPILSKTYDLFKGSAGDMIKRCGTLFLVNGSITQYIC